MKRLLFLLVALSLSACETQTPVAPDLAQGPATFVPIHIPEGASLNAQRAALPASAQEQVTEQQGEAAQTGFEAQRAIAAATTWEEANRVATGAYEAVAGNPFAYLTEQVAGSAVLQAVAAHSAEWRDVAPEARAIHVDVLLRNRHQDASVLLPALDRLDGFWPAERLAAAREQVEADAEVWLQGKCGLCDAEAVAALRSDAADAQQQRAARVYAALHERTDA